MMSSMNHELICNWLGLPPEAWPPNHYQLLDLPLGESNLALIEERVHQKLDCVRRYQVMYPEQATEAMNRLAQAFVCLTNPPTKKAYDEQLLGKASANAPPVRVDSAGNPDLSRPDSPTSRPSEVVPPPLPTTIPPPLPASSNLPAGSLVWLYTPGVSGPEQVPPPPVRGEASEPSSPATVVADDPPQVDFEPPAPVAPPPEPPAKPIDLMFELARSPQMRQGLATLAGIQRRLAQTERLLELWNRLGVHLDNPEAPLTKQVAIELYKLAGEVEEIAERFPLLGQAGQPGYQIVSLSLPARPRALLLLTPEQRESLQRDWQISRKFLEEHRAFLLQESATLQRLRLFGRLTRYFSSPIDAKWAFLILLVLTGLMALAFGVLRSL